MFKEHWALAILSSYLKKSLDRIEHQLDIRSFFAMYTNLTLLRDVLLSKEQKLLFANQHKKSLTLY